MLALAVLSDAAQSAEILDDFSQGGWAITNKKTPGKVEASKGKLVITDLPGGEVTWGTAAFKGLGVVDLKETPYLVVDLVGTTGAFFMKLTGTGEGWRKTSVGQTSQPGLVVVDIPVQTGWKGSGKLNVGLYASGDGTSIEVRAVKITGKLNEAEKEALKREKSNAPASVAAPKFAGLEALSQRQGVQPMGLNPADGERTVYRDPVTGHDVWRMTSHPSIERHVYYDILAWNANGSTLMFLSRRPGGSMWLMNADGTNIRPLPEAQDDGMVKAPHWSASDPNIVYFARGEETCTRVLTMDVRDGSVAEVVSVPFPGQMDEKWQFSELPPPHPDGRHFLLRWGGQDKLPTILVVAEVQTGKYWKLDTGLPTHRVRFTKKDDLSVFVNSNTDPDRPGVRARTEWVISVDGSKRQLPPGGGHPDWTPDGSWLGVFSGGGINLISHDGKTVQTLIKTQAGGHGGFSITTGRYHVADAPHGGPYRDLVYVTELATGQLTPLAYHGSSYSGWSSAVPDPEATHPAPICSPDETKVIYDSDLFGQPDIWVVVWQRPGAPREVRFADGVLTWTAPELHREVAGYNVYRQAGGPWELAQGTVSATRLAGLEDGTYAVAAQEWSGLESLYAIANSGGLTRDAIAPSAPAGLQAQEVGPVHAVLDWTAVEADDLDHYNVYASTDAHCFPGRATLVGSPQRPHFVDWGLGAGTTYRYRVTAVDRQGHESAPSAQLALTTDGVAGAVIRLDLEVETGTIEAPMQVAQGERASNGAYVHVPDEYSDEQYVMAGSAQLTFDVPQDGVYIFWGRAMGLDGASNSLFVSLDNGPDTVWSVTIPRKGEPDFVWGKIGGLEGVPLKKGQHELLIKSREDGTRADKITVTNDWSATIED